MQIGYCGLDKESLGAGPDAASLDITDYCEGYVRWDLLMIFIQVSRWVVSTTTVPTIPAATGLMSYRKGKKLSSTACVRHGLSPSYSKLAADPGR